jgi:hypothetical protein
MHRTLAFATMWVVCGCFCSAAPAPPFEELLKRAETVLITRVTALTERKVTLHRMEVLRGDSEADLTFGFAEWNPAFLRIGDELLLVSQGDARYGAPRPILGRPIDAQQVWCGWTPLPISRSVDNVYAGPIFSFVDGKPYDDVHDETGAKLSLARIKRLLERFPYDPHINDKT